MGLDITAYEKITQIDCLFNADEEPVDKTTGEPLDGEDFRIARKGPP
jgi:hypothetical protein